jgi:MFS family permease
VLFTAASAACALAPNSGLLIAARAVQGLGSAAVTPLALTILAKTVPAQRRGSIVGILGGIGGLAVATGPLVGGAVVQGLDWHWIFWIIAWALVRAGGSGWGDPEAIAAFAIGAVLLAGFVLRERQAAEPMLPLRLFRVFQLGLGYSPLATGLRLLPWTATPMVVAPLAGALADRIGTRPLLVTGLVLQASGLAWVAAVASTTSAVPRA